MNTQDTPPAEAAGISTPVQFWPVRPAPLQPYPPTIAPATSLRNAADMIRDLKRAPGLKASGLRFDWCVTEANYDLEPTIVKAQFGDGYAQRRPAGINTQSRKWNLSMKNITQATATDVGNFLQARNGVEVFNWIPPRTTTTEDVICPSWNVAWGDLMADGSLLFSITMKFEEAFV